MANTKIPVELSSTPGIVDGSNATAITIDSSERVGIGTTSPTGKLEIAATGTNEAPHRKLVESGDTREFNIYNDGSGNGRLVLADSDDDTSDTEIVLADNGNIQFKTATSERMLIDSSGNVGIGTTSPGDTLHIVTDSSTTNDTVDVARIEATSSGTPAAGFGPTIDFRGERGSASSDSMGRIGYVADTMTASRIDGAFIVETAVDGTYSEHLRVTSTGKVGIGTTSPDRKLHLNEAASSTSNFIHLTTADTGTTGSNGFLVGIGSDGAAELWNYEAQRISFATSSTERMRIDSSGNVLVGTTSTSVTNSGMGFQVANHAANQGQFNTGTSAYQTEKTISLYSNAVTAYRFYVTAGGEIAAVNTAITSLSDERLKSNIVDANPQLEDVKKVKVRKYTLDSTGETHIGVIAQELEEAGMGGLVAEREETGYKGVKYSILYMKAIKAIQEQQTIIEDLKARIETLEGGE